MPSPGVFRPPGPLAAVAAAPDPVWTACAAGVVGVHFAALVGLFRTGGMPRFFLIPRFGNPPVCSFRLFLDQELKT